MGSELRALLEGVRRGEVPVEEAERRLKGAPYADIGYAKVDLHRRIRQGRGEVIYGGGKTPAQIAGIVEAMRKNGQEQILITRLTPEAAEALKTVPGLEYDETARLAWCGEIPEPRGRGAVVVAAGGTSDLPVAEEAALTAAFYGSRVERLYDVGVAGLHRLLSNRDVLLAARVIVAVAGMEGALPSVIGGIADCPVIAVPTSVGYGASFGGLSALLGMLNSCAAGVSVVNIDNGFGAGFLAARIDRMGDDE